MRYCLIFALAAVAGCSGCKERQGVDPRIADPSRPLVLVTHPTEPPFSYRDATGAIVGIEIDLARRIAAKLGRPLTVDGVEFADILPRLRAGTADMGISTITITEARRRDVDFSKPYDTGGACFLYRKNGRKPRMSQIASFRIGVDTDTVQDIYLCRHGCDPMRFSGLGEAMAALERDEIDALFFDAPPLRASAELSGGTLIVSPLETLDFYGIAVDKRRPDVLAAANAVIDERGAK